MGMDDNTIVMFTTDNGTIRNSLRESLSGCDPARR
jgi:arylsulfatase A-like enzyme